MDAVNLPDHGIELVVFSRFDSDRVPAARSRICARPGAESEGGPLLLHLYNTTGRGISGFHYDPVFLEGPIRAAHPVVVASGDEEGEDAGGPAPKQPKPLGGGRSRGRQGFSGELQGAEREPRRSGRLKRAPVAGGECGSATPTIGAAGGIGTSASSADASVAAAVSVRSVPGAAAQGSAGAAEYTERPTNGGNVAELVGDVDMEAAGSAGFDAEELMVVGQHSSSTRSTRCCWRSSKAAAGGRPKAAAAAPMLSHVPQ